MKNIWWMLVMALGMAGALVVRRRLRIVKTTIADEEEKWPYEKNFGAFPPEIPDSAFEGLT